ncbi:hypothetical protein [Leptospira levettii]|uniref:hypothetical protein n=1 Tax=Leptospira levettii TaxID=2023178 RepID=UPI000C2A89D1|nr:hypothetical protein [Leptospira levettii]PJZ89540.1 hypothetical protein CH368_06165 [Leptospira levettii]
MAIAELDGFYGDLPHFNHGGPIFKDLIGDPSREILEPVLSINDINQGAIFNSLYNHVMHCKLAAKSVVLTQAEALYLDKWGEFFDIPRPSGFTDPAYIGFILGRILSAIASLPQIARLFKGIPGARVFVVKDMGFFSDYSVSDVGVINPDLEHRLASGVVTPMSNAVYVYVPSLSLVTRDIIAQAEFVQAGGTAIFFGEYPV